MRFRQLGCSYAIHLPFLDIADPASRSGVLDEAPAWRELSPHTREPTPQPVRSSVTPPSLRCWERSSSADGVVFSAEYRLLWPGLRPAMHLESLSIPRAPARTDDQYILAMRTTETGIIVPRGHCSLRSSTASFMQLGLSRRLSMVRTSES
ncbi:hypothetical protein L226DRAFT_92977 [Lentinus tigrinus ALCF2SS1-7]|uniref:uncharacterized protein n=1 Tax=Lentinus tigrinus ALCF2SS1-7 TaxID=1328758 RepID=UPI001165D044|nr:hypothetical protein L226DRAFT_92977 [Lentinus tigrinus ALCF2SS1-7]